MSRRKRWVSFNTLTIGLMMVLGLSFGSIALAQEARWNELAQKTNRLLQKGKFQEGVRFAKKALSVAEKTFGENHINYAISLSQLALAYVAQDRPAEAEPLRERALAIAEKTLERTHPCVATILTGLAWVYKAQGRSTEAERLYKRARPNAEKTPEPAHPFEVAKTLNDLASFCLQQQGPSPGEETIPEPAQNDVVNVIVVLAVVLGLVALWFVIMGGPPTTPTGKSGPPTLAK